MGAIFPKARRDGLSGDYAATLTIERDAEGHTMLRMPNGSTLHRRGRKP